MAKEYRIGKTTFGNLEAKETWIIEGVLMDIEYVLKHGKDLGPSGKDFLRIGQRKLANLIKARRKRERSGRQ